MRALGGLLVGVGVLLAIIASAWGRSGFYVSQAPILGVLALVALASLGIGLGMLRYQKSSMPTAQDARSSIAARAFAPSPPARLVGAPAAPPSPAAPPAAAAPIAPATSVTSELDEATRDRPARTTAWVLLLPDHTEIPVADALVVGRQPVSSDGGPTAAVPSPEVSKSHVRFRVVDGQLRVRDLDTTNGTIIVHGDETEEHASAVAETVIDDGDRLEIGSYAMRVQRRL